MIGQVFTFSMLRAIYPIPYGITFLSQDLRSLVEADFLLMLTDDGDVYSFKSISIRWVRALELRHE